MNSLKQAACDQDADWLTQMDQIIDFLDLNVQPEMRLAFTKFLRVNLTSVEKEDVFRDMILETKVVDFILKNLQSKPLLFESTFFLANATQFNDSDVCEKLVNRLLLPTSNLIDIKEFQKYI